MKCYSNTYTQKVYEVLLPIIGDVMSKEVLKTVAISLGTLEESFVLEDMPYLAERIAKGLVVFLGSDTASKIATRISQIK